MQTETVEVNKATVVVRSRYRRTPIITAQYSRALREAYPEMAAFEKAMFAVVYPDVQMKTIKENDLELRVPATDDDKNKLDVYYRAMAPLEVDHQEGRALVSEANDFLVLAPRIASAVNAPFAVDGNGRMDAANVKKAFESFLDDEDLWNAVAVAIKKLDAPLTDVDLRPPEALTAEEKVNPLSAAAD